MKSGYVYIMASTTRTLYIGVTSDLERRVWEHKTHVQPGFSNRCSTDRLVYLAEFSRMDDALAWEKTLKGKTRAKKVALIEERNPRGNDLAWNWYEGHPASQESASRGDGSALRVEGRSGEGSSLRST